MSEDELNTEGEEQSESQEPAEIDIEIEETPPAGGGRGVWTVIVLIIILAAIAWYLFWAIGKAQEREELEREARLQAYSIQQRQIGRELDGAFEMLEDNDVAGAVEALSQAALHLRTLASRAAADQDTAESTQIELKAKQAEDSAAEIAAMQAELVELSREKMAALQRSLGLRVTGDVREEEAPAEEPSEETIPETPPEEPVSPEVSPAPPEEVAPPPEGEAPLPPP